MMTSTSCNAWAQASKPDWSLSLTTAAVGTEHGFKLDGIIRVWFQPHGADVMISANRRRNGLTTRAGRISGPLHAATRFTSQLDGHPRRAEDCTPYQCMLWVGHVTLCAPFTAAC